MGWSVLFSFGEFLVEGPLLGQKEPLSGRETQGALCEVAEHYCDHGPSALTANYRACDASMLAKPNLFISNLNSIVITRS
jgi:hypothetical protein